MRRGKDLPNGMMWRFKPQSSLPLLVDESSNGECSGMPESFFCYSNHTRGRLRLVWTLVVLKGSSQTESDPDYSDVPSDTSNFSTPDFTSHKNNLTVRQTLRFRPGTRINFSNSTRALAATGTW